MLMSHIAYMKCLNGQYIEIDTFQGESVIGSVLRHVPIIINDTKVLGGHSKDVQ